LLQAEGLHLFVGEAAFQGSGKYEWADDDSKPASSELVLTAQNPVPAGIIVGILSPGTDVSNAGGTIKGSLAFAGTADNLLTHGDFTLHHVSVPAWNVNDVDGRLHSPRWTLSTGDSDGGSVSQLQVQIGRATVLGVPARDLNGTIVLQGG